jgi:hypothetical protein
MIIEKAYEIEENMKMDSKTMNRIDMSVIEDLKRRRLEQKFNNEMPNYGDY